MITAGSTLFPLAKSSIWAAGALLLLSSQAFADSGLRAIHIGCDVRKDAIVIEPFIIWNGEYRYDDTDLSALRKRHNLSIGGDSYEVAYPGRPYPVFRRTCHTATRTVTVSGQTKLLVAEKIASATRYVHAALVDNYIGFAWEVAGPTWRMQSTKPGSWETCTGPGEYCVQKRLEANPPPITATVEDWAK